MKLHEAMEEVLSSHTLAVIPLAILMAISPLNSSAQEKKLVRSQDILGLHIKYYDLNGDITNIEMVRGEASTTSTKMALLHDVDFHDIYGNVKSINKCNYNVVGDDGVSVGTWTVSYVTLDGPEDAGKYLMNPEFVEAIEKFANSKENNGAVEINNYHKNLQVGYSDIENPYNIRKFKLPSDFHHDLGKKLKDFPLQTTIGDYKLTLYSNDENDEDCETVFVERPDPFMEYFIE